MGGRAEGGSGQQLEIHSPDFEERTQQAQEETSDSEQRVARMLDSFGGISEAGSVAHVLALDALDAVKDIAKTR